MHKVMIHPTEYDDCHEAIRRAFSLFPLEIKGRKVMIKPNAMNDSHPDQGAVTHPSILGAVLDILEDSGAGEIIVGDNPGAMESGANEETFHRNGLMEASRGYYENIGSDAVEIDISSRYFSRVSLSRRVMEADIFISIPKFKTHGLTVISGAIKNSYGILPGAQKVKGHSIAGNPLRFHELIVDIFGLRIPDLFIVDGIVGMEGNGPVSNELRHMGQILAADNAVALDATIARIMSLNPDNLRFIQLAKEKGYGEYDEEAIEIIGDLVQIPDFKLPPSAERRGEGVPPDFEEMTHRLSLMRPLVDENLCSCCMTCVEKCPVSALSIVNGFPLVDPQKCIVCFCCQESCPEKAIQLN